MAGRLLKEMKSHLALAEADTANLRALLPILEPALDGIVDAFYRRLFADPRARAIFQGGQEQIDRQRLRLRDWLAGLFTGVYDEAYYDQRLNIGRVHVRVGLPQHFMPTAMEIVRQELKRALAVSPIPNTPAMLESLDKILSLELTIMLESYQQAYEAKIRDEERAVVEEKLTRSEHLAQIGQLAASLAHEIKNPLAGISGAIQVLRDSMQQEDPHRAIIGEILSQINRLDATVKDLLIFARPRQPDFGLCNLCATVQRVIRLMTDSPPLRRVRVYTDCGEGVPPIRADEGQMEQLIMNLLLNAAHASKQGDQITISLRSNGRNARLIIADTGKGMDQHILARAFEPFFTTKAKGTGLGLSICRKIVEAHHGSMTLTSKLNEGTEAIIELPIAGGPMTHDKVVT